MRHPQTCNGPKYSGDTDETFLVALCSASDKKGMVQFHVILECDYVRFLVMLWDFSGNSLGESNRLFKLLQYAIDQTSRNSVADAVLGCIGSPIFVSQCYGVKHQRLKSLPTTLTFATSNTIRHAGYHRNTSDT